MENNKTNRLLEIALLMFIFAVMFGVTAYLVADVWKMDGEASSKYILSTVIIIMMSLIYVGIIFLTSIDAMRKKRVEQNGEDCWRIYKSVSLSKVGVCIGEKMLFLGAGLYFGCMACCGGLSVYLGIIKENYDYMFETIGLLVGGVVLWIGLHVYVKPKYYSEKQCAKRIVRASKLHLGGLAEGYVKEFQSSLQNGVLIKRDNLAVTTNYILLRNKLIPFEKIKKTEVIINYVSLLAYKAVYKSRAVVICELEDGTQFEQLIFIGLEEETEMFRRAWKRHVQDKLWY